MSDRLLSVEGLSAGYGDMYVLEDVGLHVEDGEFVAIVGPNGAGKSTLLRTVMGETTLHDGSVTYDGTDITWTPPNEVVDLGVGYVPQEEAVFGDLSVWENLRMGGYTSGDIGDRLPEIYDLFPRLEERTDQVANTLSGGERRMLAVARALVPEPDLLLVDEPSAGLAPQIVERMFDRLDEIHADGTTVLLVEQNVDAAFDSADRVYTLSGGTIESQGDPETIRDSYSWT